MNKNMGYEIATTTNFILFIWAMTGFLFVAAMPRAEDPFSGIKQIFIGGPLVWMVALATFIKDHNE